MATNNFKVVLLGEGEEEKEGPAQIHNKKTANATKWTHHLL